MAKGKKPVKREKKTFAIDVGSEDDLYDEQDQFHKEDRKIGKGKIRQVHGKKVEEVLNVEGDDSEEEEDDGNSDFSEPEELDPDDEANLPSKEQWGRKRKDFYKSGYVDNDYGGVGSSDEEELAHLEEVDAVSRQKQLDATAALAALEDDVWAEEKTEEKEPVKSDKKAALTVEKKWNVELAREKNEETVEWIKEYKRTREVCESIIDMLPEITAALPKESATRKQLLLVGDTYAAYLLNLTYYLSLKSASFKEKRARDAAVDEHPVVEKLEKMKKLVRNIDSFLGKNYEAVIELKERLERGGGEGGMIVDDEIVVKKRSSALAEMEDSLEGMGMEDREEEGEGGEGKRGVGYHITKNIQLNKKRKKGPSHSRAQKKVQYHKALIKRRSQVPDVRREDARYAGEARGIRAGTVKSTKLIA